MTYYLMKVLITSSLIVIISEVSRRSSLFASILASVPLVSLLAFIWIYIETKKTETLIPLSRSIFWMVLPSLSFFLLFPRLLEKGHGFTPSLLISLAVMITLYFLMVLILRFFHITL